MSHAYCQRAFDLANQGCAKASDWLAQSGYTTLNDCASGFTFMHGHTCANTVSNECAPDDFSGSRASQCASDAMNLTCDFDWSSGATPTTSACTFMCCVHQGNPGSGLECCSGKSHVEQTSCGLAGTDVCD